MSSLNEIEADLNKIEKKYSSRQSVANSFEHKETLVKLSQDLDSLGLPQLKLNYATSDEILEDIIKNTFAVIQLYRKSIKQVNDLNVTKQSSDLHYFELNTDLKKYEAILEDKERKIKNLNLKVNQLKNEGEEYKKENGELKDLLKRMKSYCKHKEDEKEHKIKKLEMELHVLKQKCGEVIGTYISKDTIVMEQLNKYKQKEEVYKSTILKLQNNNDELLGEILKLTEEVTMYIANQSNSPL